MPATATADRCQAQSPTGRLCRQDAQAGFCLCPKHLAVFVARHNAEQADATRTAVQS